jgi:hypothetical protein
MEPTRDEHKPSIKTGSWTKKELSAMAFHIRNAQAEDVAALARLHVQTFNETHRDGRSGGPSYELREQQWREAFASRDNPWFCLVVEDEGGQLVGFAKGTLHDGSVPGRPGAAGREARAAGWHVGRKFAS